METNTAMNRNDAAGDPLAVARSVLLEPHGLDVKDLNGAIGRIFEHKVDYADLYFQYTRSEGWSLDEGIVKSSKGWGSVRSRVIVRPLRIRTRSMRRR